MDWDPSNEPSRYDRARVARTDPIAREIGRLGLPLIRKRKLNGILNALVVQIEDGGDSPEVNRVLLDALREGLRHQVGEHRAMAALRAIETFEEAEAERWERVRAGTLPAIELTPEEQLEELVQEGYDLLQAEQQTTACDKWRPGPADGSRATRQNKPLPHDHSRSHGTGRFQRRSYGFCLGFIAYDKR